nr:integrase, catalytic region, zinc finger, CCHC-type, peptidase aspartic, catalytic [Tanacetum cinerariifolium]
LQDDLILSVIEQLKTQVVNCTKINQDTKQVNELLTAELERYRNQERVLKEQLNDNQASEKESLTQKITLLKNDFQKEESRNIDKELALEKQVKELNNIVFKRSQSAQTVYMLTKPQVFYNHSTRQALGFQNPCYLKKAQQLKPKLYDGCIIEKSEAIVVLDTEETLMLVEEIEVLKELPKVGMVNSCLKKLKFHLASFDMAQAKDTVILKLKKKLNSLNGDVKERKVKRDVEEIETLNIELDHKVTKLAAENDHLKQTYKQLYDSVKSSRVRSKEQCNDLINKVNLKSAEVSDLNASLQEKVLVDVALLVPKLRKNRTAHTDYIRHTQEEAVTLREIVESERILSPLNTSLVYACKYTRRIQELLMILQQTCPCLTNLGTKLVAVTPKNKTNQIRYIAKVTKSERTTVTTPPSTNLDSNTPMFSSTGVNLVSSASGSLSQDNTKHNRIRRTQKKAKKNKIEGRIFTLVGNVCPLTRIATPTIVPLREPIPKVNSTDKPVVTLVVQIILWYLDSGCSKHMTGDHSQLVNFVQKFLGTVKFGNDHVVKIMGYRDYQIGNVTISRVYYVEGLGHNLFSIGQFCDSDLEVAFRQHTCFIRNLDGVDLLTGSWENNLYTLSIQDMMMSSPICLLSKASKSKSWLWHRRLSHLNFGAINHLARQGTRNKTSGCNT